MVHSHNDREGSGSPSRKRSRSPAGEHSPDAPAAKRRSPTPEDSADTGPDRRRSDFTRLGSPQRPSRRSQGRTSPSAYLMPRTSSSPGNARSPACPPDGQGDYTPPFNFDLSGVPRRVRNVGPSSPSLRTPTATQDLSINPAPASNSEDSMFDASVALNEYIEDYYANLELATQTNSAQAATDSQHQRPSRPSTPNSSGQRSPNSQYSDTSSDQDGSAGLHGRLGARDRLSDQVHLLEERCREQRRRIEELERDKSDIWELCDRRNAALRAEIDALRAQLANAQQYEHRTLQEMLEARQVVEEHLHAAQQALRDLGEAQAEIAAGRQREADYQAANLRLAAGYRRPDANLNTSQDRISRPGEFSPPLEDDDLAPTTPVEATTPRPRSPIPARVRPRRTHTPSRAMPPSSPGQSSPTPAQSSSSRPRLRVSIRSAYQGGNPVVVYGSRPTRSDVEDDAVATFDDEEYVSDSEKGRNEEARAEEDDELADLVKKEETTPVIHSRARSNSRSA